MAQSPIIVVGHESLLEREGGPSRALRELGAAVITCDLWDDVASAVVESGASDRTLGSVVFDADERPDLAVAALRTLRKDTRCVKVKALLAVSPRRLADFQPSWGFDDFIVLPCAAAELYARLRALEWSFAEFENDERIKIGSCVIDRAGHEVSIAGRAIALTAKEFALLACLAENRGKLLSRESLLARVWGAQYEGGERTVDIHVTRLRAKLGDDVPIETLRRAGYKLRVPQTDSAAARSSQKGHDRGR